ncbi:MAG TPA: nucleotide sugar dehydrogenase [Acidimicrobiales bacterium]|nr:nucleotide sugar dehydrogenase [Acidimicrobiales bacterium]
MTATDAGAKVVVCGMGYVGLPVAMRATEVGYRVTGYDVDANRIKRLLAAESYVDDVSGAMVADAMRDGRFTASDDPSACADFDFAVICVPTPLKEGAPDLSYVEAAAATLAPYVRKGSTVILESTTYPGTTQELVQPILDQGADLTAGADFHLGYSPERIDPGNPDHTFVGTPKIVSGIDEPSLTAVKAFYDTLVDTTVPVSSPKEAELAKLLENTFRHVNVALVNELAVFANALGVDLHEAIDAASTKPFGFMPFRPGPGVGGHCLPIDPSYLSWRVKRAVGRSFRFIELANDVNDVMPDYVVSRIQAGLNTRGRSVKGSRLLVLGLAYKRNTGDSRESPSLMVAERLQALGADVRAVDPLITEVGIAAGIPRAELTADELKAADAVVILTDHDALDYDAVVANAAYVFDTRHRVSGENVEQL